MVQKISGWWLLQPLNMKLGKKRQNPCGSRPFGGTTELKIRPTADIDLNGDVSIGMKILAG
jgi:hypothetical protein